MVTHRKKLPILIIVLDVIHPLTIWVTEIFMKINYHKQYTPT
jgi:hypothetical protein